MSGRTITRTIAGIAAVAGLAYIVEGGPGGPDARCIQYPPNAENNRVFPGEALRTMPRLLWQHEYKAPPKRYNHGESIGLVLRGPTLYFTQMVHLTGLDIADGKERLRRKGFNGHLTIGGSVLYSAGASTAIAYDLDARKQLWSAPIGINSMAGWRQVRHSLKPNPLVYKGKVILAGYAPKVTCLDAGTGRQLWQMPLKTEARTGAITRHENVAYLTTFDTWPKGAAKRPHPNNRRTNDAELIALDLDTGKRIWTTQIGPKAAGQVTYHQGKVLLCKRKAGGRNNHVFAYDAADGKEVWSFPAAVSGGPFAIRGDFAALCGGGEKTGLTVVNLKGRKLAWRHKPKEILGITSVCVVGRTVYLGDEIRGGSAETLRITAFDLQTGKQLWRWKYPMDNPQKKRWPRTMSILPVDGKLYAFCILGRPVGSRVICLGPQADK